MPSIFSKSGSTAGRAKTRNKSIRGTISAPIPIPRTPDDDEFPIRNPGSAKATTAVDDEFPMRRPGTGIATTLPPTEGPTSPPEEPVEQPVEPALEEQQNQEGGDAEPSSDSSTEREQEQGKMEDLAVAGPAPVSVSGGSGGSRTDLARENRPEPPSTPPPAPPTQRPPSRPASRSPHNQTPSRKSSPLRVSPSRTSPPTRRATNPVLNTIRYSIVSDAPSRNTTQSKDGPQRKKSTLRAALGRLFGRGKKKNGSGSQGSGAASARESGPLAPVQQHRSDPTALGRPGQRSPKRSASLPISEFDRPLRSHSIGPEDIMAIESARNSLQVEAAGAGSSPGALIRRRAATTGGHALLRPHLFNREFGAGLSPRPASAQGRASRTDRRTEAEDPSEIGRAITSDSGGGHRRRSRSLSQLQDFAGAQAGRRRSDEIRYWRESYDPGFMSPLSSNAQDDVDDTAMVNDSAPESPAVERPPKTPPQPFNFGLLSKEMIGMKITHAADMDMRLVNLESRTVQLEHVVDRLCHAVPGFKKPFATNEMSQPGVSHRSLEADVFNDEAPANTSSLFPASPSTAKAKSPPTLATPLSGSSTVRGATSLPTLGREPPMSTTSNQTRHDELIAQLRSDLDAERAARQALEAQVKKLSDRVNTLSSTMFAMVRGPSESRSQERLGTASSSSVLGSSPSKASLLVVAHPQPPPTSALLPRGEGVSVFESDDDDDGDGDNETEGGGGEEKMSLATTARTRLGKEEGEGLTEDDFQTPGEGVEGTPGLGVVYGAFGEELGHGVEGEEEGVGDEDDENKRRKAARTLSLSQLTLGKGQRTRI